MVTFTRHGTTDVFVEGPIASARCGIIARGLNVDALDFAPQLLTTCSFAVWDDLQNIQSAAITAFFNQLALAHDQLPTTRGAIFFGPATKGPGLWGRIEFSRVSPWRLVNTTEVEIQMGSDRTALKNAYRLRIKMAAGESTKLSITGSDFVISHPAPASRFSFAKGTKKSPTMRGDVVLKFTGSEAPTFRFAADITDEAVFAALAATLRADFRGKQFGSNYIPISCKFPLFRPYQPATGGAVHTIALAAVIDPFLLNPSRSGLALSAYDGANGEGLIETHLITNYGEPVLLRCPSAIALASGAAMAPRLVFVEQGTDSAGPFDRDLSLLPHGDFDLVLPSSARYQVERESFGIMCGLSEREYIPVSQGQRLAFRANQPAYAGDFPEEGIKELKAPGFVGHTRTSWMAITSDDGTPATTVVAEDAAYSAFDPGPWAAARSALGEAVLLTHRPLKLHPRKRATVADADVDPIQASLLPVFPWRGVRVASDEGAKLRLVENRILTPNRRMRLEPAVSTLSAAEAALAAPEVRYTPLGLEMEIAPGGRIQSLLLAKVDKFVLRLDDIQSDLADALSRSNLFLVCDHLTGLAKLSPEISIANWGFGVDIPDGPGPAGADRPVMIIKGRKGTLASLLDQTEGWALPEKLCSMPAKDMAIRIRQLHDKRPPVVPHSEEENAQALAFKKIDAIYNDPDWTGVLIFNVKMDASKLPAQITGLLGGSADTLKTLRVHHLGIDVKRLDPGAADARTPLFGALTYVDKDETAAPKLEEGNYYAFKLGRMVVSFDNGGIGVFKAWGKLAISRLFDGDAKDPKKLKLKAPGAATYPVVDIRGDYESRVQDGKKIDVYTFQALIGGAGQRIVMPDGGLIREVGVTRLVFATQSVQPTATGELDVRTLFLIDGAIIFNEWPSGTLAVIPDGARFAFTGLGVGYNFTLSLSHLSVAKPRFDFRPGGISLDFGALPAMKGLLGKLPFKFRSFELWPEGIDFPKLGFTRLSAGRPGSEDDGKYGFVFDLDLGSLGALAQKLKDFKISLLLGFGYIHGKSPQFALGFKFAGSGGTGLDVGIGNILKIRADSYEVGKHPQKELYYAYALNARLVVMGREIPKDAKLNLFLFVDPAPGSSAPAFAVETAAERRALERRIRALSPLSSVGWFGVMTDSDSGGFVSVDTLAVGQRIQLFPGEPPGPGMTVKSYVDRIGAELGGQKLPQHIKDALDRNDITVVTREMLSRIVYAPSRAWVIGLSAKVARDLDFDILISDPDLYGIHINFKGFIDLDVLYRKLSEDLGVYSVVIVPPAAIRRISAGAADIMLPSVGLDFYTDGGFHGSLGYPYNRDFSQSATVEILPFLGAGGLRVGLFKSGGATMVPKPVGDRYLYNPVIELGIGLRVGVGKSYESGPFRAGVALTIFAYLEGALGRLEDLRSGQPPSTNRPAETFYAVRGAFGILGEIYGSVDFGIVKARVEIVLYVEASIQLRTDDHILLGFEAGVSVRVSVVIARFRVFGKTIEIRVSFSYSTTISYQTTLGSRRSDFDRVYQDTHQRLGFVGTNEWRELTPAQRTAWLAQTIAWAPPSLETLGLAQKDPLSLWFMPDITAALDPAAPSAVPEAVFKLYLESELKDPAGKSPYDVFAERLTVWLLWNGVRDLRAAPKTADRPLDWTITAHQLDLLLGKLTGEPNDPQGVRRRLPDYDDWVALFGSCFAVELVRAPVSPQQDTRTAVFFPMPQEVEILRYFPSGKVSTHLETRQFVSPTFEEEIECQFAWMKATWESQEEHRISPLRATDKTLAAVLFEEFFGFLLRSLAQAAERVGRGGSFTVPDLLTALREQKDGSRPLREVGASASRFFNHGLALPRPGDAIWQVARNHVPAPLVAIGDADPNAALPIFRYASLQLGLKEKLATAPGVEQAQAVGLRRAAGATWFAAAADLARIEVAGDQAGDDPISELAAASERLDDYAASVRFYARLDESRIVSTRPCLYTPPSTRELFDPASGTREAFVFELPADLINSERVDYKTVKATLRTVGTTEEGLTLICAPAVAVAVTLRRAKDVAADNGRRIFEIAGARETERRLLDVLSPEASVTAFEAGQLPAIERVELYVDTGKDGPLWKRLSKGAAIAQTNLSIDANPDTQIAFDEKAPTFYAPQSDAVMFTELFRRASIVNSGGFWFMSADSALASDDINLLMVVILKDAKCLLAANALVATAGQGSFNVTSQLDRLTADTSDKVVVIEAGAEERLLPRPGQLPLEITVPNPSLGYYVADHSGPRMLSFEQMAAEIARSPGAHGLRLSEAMLRSHPDVQLRERFNLLEVLIVEDGDFKATLPGRLLPVGDTEPNTQASAALSNDPPKSLRFVHTLPIAHNLRQPSLNPYAAVGKRLHLNFRLRDINGNALPGGPREAYGPLSGPLEVEYYDGLIALSELPYLTASYGPGSSANTLRVTLTFDETTYRNAFSGAAPLSAEAIATRARSARQVYQTALWQAEGPGFEFLLESTLAVAPGAPPPSSYDLARPERAKFDPAGLLTFYRDVITLLDHDLPANAGRRTKIAPAAPPKAVLNAPLGAASLRAAFIEPSAFLVLRRGIHVHESIKNAANAEEVRFEARPAFETETSETAREAALKVFARDLSRVVLGDRYVGAKGGPSVAGRPGASLWLIRTDVLPRTTSPGAPGDPSYLGLPPLSNRPQSFESFKHPQSDIGDKLTTGEAKLIDVDMDVYGKLALERIDTLLAPRQILRMTRLPEGCALLSRTLAVKEWLAGQLADHVLPILANVSPPETQSTAAKEALKSKLMGRLSVAYEVDTLLAYNILWPARGQVEGPRPAVYGRLEVTPKAPARSAASEVTMIAVPDKNTDRSPLTVFYDALQPNDFPLPVHAVDVGPFTVTHVQRIPQPDRSQLLKLPTEERYRATQWLRLLDPWVVTQLNKDQRVPVALRETPSRPTVTSQRAASASLPASSLANMRLWTFEASWSWQGKPADTPKAIVDYWKSSDDPGIVRVDDNLDPLAKALLAFCLATDACWPRLMGADPPSAALLSYLDAQLLALTEIPFWRASGQKVDARDVVEFLPSAGKWTPKPDLLPGHRLGAATAISSSAGLLAIEGIDVMKFSRAHFSMELYRNRDFDLGSADGIPTPANPAFVYHLSGIAAGAPKTPCLVRDEPLTSPRRKASLTEHFTGLLTELFQDGAGRQRFDIHVSLAPRALPEALAQLIPNSTERDWSGVALPGAIGLYSDKQSEWLKVAVRLEAWLAASAPARPEGHLQIGVKVYREDADPASSEARNQPIFQAARLRIPLSLISLPARAKDDERIKE